MESVRPEPLEVVVDERRVPAVVWRAGEGSGLVLLGHGGSGHKTSRRQREIADRLVAVGLAVVAIDGPAHGERATRPMAPGEYQALLVERGVESVARQLVSDWSAALTAARAAGAAADRVGYLGMSMGTRFGLPLVATLGADLTCAVLGKFGLEQSPALHPGLHDPLDLRTQAGGVVVPTLWHAQWDDELFPRSGQLELFDRIAAEDKQLVAFPGGHGTTSKRAVDTWIAFLVDHLSA